MTDERDLGRKIKEGQDYIEVEGDLANKVIRIKATGKVAWGVCAAGLTVAIGALIVTLTSAGTSAPVTVPTSFVGLGTSAAVLGAGTASSAAMIGAAGGGIATLNKLRKYRIEKISEDKIILHKK